MNQDRRSGPESAQDLLAGDPSRPAAWIPVASGQAALSLSGTGLPGQEPLRLDFDFKDGGGFVVARREIAASLPEAWELRVRIRGDAPPNTLEIKIADAAGTSVWRWRVAEFAPSAEWSELRIAGHAFEFAWGPAGGGAPQRIGAVEVAVVAPPGGKGRVELGDLRVIDRGIVRFSHVEASSCAPGSDAAMAVDGDPRSSWRSGDQRGAHTLTLVFDDPRDVGGLVVQWRNDARPRTFRIELQEAGGQWQSRYDVPEAGADVSFVPLAELAACALRIVALAADPLAGVGIADVALHPYGWAGSTSEFLTKVALRSRRGAFPRYLLREQLLWTPVATPTGGPVGLLSEDGAVEIGEGGFTVEPSLYVDSAAEGPDAERWITWADVRRETVLEAPPLPVATVRWRCEAVELDITPFAVDGERGPRVMVRYRVHNLSDREQCITLFVSARPYQVSPPWQAFRALGGSAPIESLSAGKDGSLQLGDSAAVSASPGATESGATHFDAGGLAAFLSRGELPPRTEARDPYGRAEAALGFPLRLEPSAFTDVLVTCWPRATGDDALQTRDTSGESARGARPLEAAIESWRSALPLATPDGGGAGEPFAVFATAIAHILACRDGAALQPGPRRYTRSWIRDGAIMSAALARAGRGDAARDFVEWYAPFQRDDGFVPCCVDRDGVDPLVENDSHGQLIYAVAETLRFTRDLEWARALWPRCERAAEWIETLRASRKTPEFEAGSRRACFGLLPESVSHEGYLSQPVHSYWDDFWALRGLRDAAFLARELGDDEDAARWRAAADDLAEAIRASMRRVMEERGLATVPASVEWADFDPTAVAGAISLVGAAELYPVEALARTFDEYLRGLRARRDGTTPWNNYSPYEVRIVGALVRLGRRDEANELLDFLLADRRPLAWNQWPEIVWRDAAAPAHLGDLPHCWIGAEYAIALRSMFVFERESDGALVVGAGLRREWLDAPAGIDLRGLPTWYGPVDLSIRRDAVANYLVAVAGAAAAPGGVVVDLPGAFTLVAAAR